MSQSSYTEISYFIIQYHRFGHPTGLWENCPALIAQAVWYCWFCVSNAPHAFWKKPRSTKVGRNWQVSPIKWKCTFKNQLTCSYLYLSFTWTRGGYYFGWNFLPNPPLKVKLLSKWFLQFTEIPLNALTCSTDTLAK